MPGARGVRALADRLGAGRRGRRGERHATAFPVDMCGVGVTLWVRAELAGPEARGIAARRVGRGLMIRAQRQRQRPNPHPRPPPQLTAGAAPVRAELAAGRYLRSFRLGVPAVVG